MKVVISNFAWMEKSKLSESKLFLLKRSLTLIPKQNGPEDVRPIEMFIERSDTIGIPRHFYLNNAEGDNEEVYDIANGEQVQVGEPAFKMREEDQEPLIQEILSKVNGKPFGGGLIQAYTGFGKSYCALELARRLGGTTLILVHKEPLMNQWVENIGKLFPGARIGCIQGPTANYRDKDFVVGMIQSMMDERGDKYPFDMYRSFRTILCDEVHRMGSECFGTVAPKFNAKYMFGLSGTIRRKDNCENVFRWVIGDIIATASEKNRLKPIVYIRDTGFKAVKKQTIRNGVPSVFNMNSFPKATQLGFISKNEFRCRLIAQDVVKALQAGRNPLVMSERLEILEKVAGYVFELGQKALGRNIQNGFYIGKKTEQELAKAAESEVVYATLQLAQEGIDIPRLDTLMLTTPISDPEQTIGRVTRNVPGKKTPMVVDYVDFQLSNFKGIFYSRLKLYKRLGWNVIGMRL